MRSSKKEGEHPFAESCLCYCPSPLLWFGTVLLGLQCNTPGATFPGSERLTVKAPSCCPEGGQHLYETGGSCVIHLIKIQIVIKIGIISIKKESLSNAAVTRGCHWVRPASSLHTRPCLLAWRMCFHLPLKLHCIPLFYSLCFMGSDLWLANQGSWMCCPTRHGSNSSVLGTGRDNISPALC